MKRILLLVASLLPYIIFAQVVRQPLTIRYAGLGAYSLRFSDVFSGTSNQASLARLSQASAGVYGERRFMLEDLGQYTAVVAVPTRSGTFALQGDYFGSSQFNESQLGFAYARKVASQVDVGVKFNYHTVQVAGYGNASAINFEAGTIFHLTDKLHTGFHVYNPVGSKLGKGSNEKLAAIFKAGLGYEASKSVFISTEFVKQEDQPVSLNAGLQYNIDEKFFLRAGVSTATSQSYVGIAFTMNTFRLDVNAGYHPQLGFTPGLLLLLNLKKAADGE